MSIFTNPASASKENARAYTAGILELLGDEDPIARLERTRSELPRAIAGLDDRALHTPEAPGKWSIAAVVAHLADSDVVWAWRLRLVLAQDRPEITGYDQDAWASRLNYADANVSACVALFQSLRNSNIALLRQRSTAADRARVGVHAERGEESVGHMMKMYAGHDKLHLDQIARIRMALG